MTYILIEGFDEEYGIEALYKVRAFNTIDEAKAESSKRHTDACSDNFEDFEPLEWYSDADGEEYAFGCGFFYQIVTV